MKKYVYLILVFFGFSANAQKGFIFKLKYLPNHQYDINYKFKVEGDINILGDDQIINQLKNQGMSLPLKLVMGMVMNANVNTGKYTIDKKFPLKLEVSQGDLDFNISGKKIPLPNNTSLKSTIIGYGDSYGKIFLDSLTTSGKKDTSKENINKVINTLQNNIIFPKEPMQIGDSFMQEIPFSLPIGNNTNATLKTIYTLVSVVDGKAIFDVTQNIQTHIIMQNSDIGLTGLGNGKMTFDIKNTFLTGYTDKIKLNFDGQFNKTAINGVLGMSIDINYVIN